MEDGGWKEKMHRVSSLGSTELAEVRPPPSVLHELRGSQIADEKLLTTRGWRRIRPAIFHRINVVQSILSDALSVVATMKYALRDGRRLLSDFPKSDTIGTIAVNLGPADQPRRLHCFSHPLPR